MTFNQVFKKLVELEEQRSKLEQQIRFFVNWANNKLDAQKELTGGDEE